MTAALQTFVPGRHAYVPNPWKKPECDAKLDENGRPRLCGEAPGALIHQDGLALIATERKRQIEKEGWTPEHDASDHDDDSLALMAVCYALPVDDRQTEEGVPIFWPFEDGFKPGDRVRELVKAGALIAAEIDRLLRKPPPAP